MAIPHAAAVYRQVAMPPAALVSQDARQEPSALRGATHRVVHLEPASGAVVDERRPEISATFVRAVNPARVQIELDGRDVSSSAFIGRYSFAYQPSTVLTPGRHVVAVTVGTHAQSTWSFSIADGVTENALNGLLPVNGSRVATEFDVTGYTRRGSHVRVLTTWNISSPGFAEGEGSSVVEAVADARGYFVAHVVVADTTSRLVDVRIQATAVDGAIAVRTLRLRRP